jgi:predicted DNA-binding transcriptional regulator AlpA
MRSVSHHLVGAVEIAAMLGVTRQRVYQLSNEDRTFPQPEVELASGRVWTREAIVKWAKVSGREIAER